MYALFGDWTPGDTAYTRLWTTSCVPTSVVYTGGSFAGWTLAANTIYVINSWTYTLTSPITMNGNCSAFIGRGDVYIKQNWNSNITTSGVTNLVIDNIKFNGQNLSSTWVYINNSSNITFNNIKIYQYTWVTSSWIALWVYNNNDNKIFINNSEFYDNDIGVKSSLNITINNSKFYNNMLWLYSLISTNTINNSQFLNNSMGIRYVATNWSINNSIFYNNIDWIFVAWSNILFNNNMLYNNWTWLTVESAIVFFSTVYSYTTWYGNLKIFGNTNDMVIESGSSFELWTTAPGNTTWTQGQIDTWTTTMDYDRVTNPQNNSGQHLLSGTNRTGTLRGIQSSFDISKTPIRYIFGWNILKQGIPVWYDGTTFEEYGTDGSDYISSRYIAEPESSLPYIQQAAINQYFWTWSTYTQNRQTNWCSLSAFQVVYLTWGIFSWTYNFQDHTIYMLTGWEYKSRNTYTWFNFNGNCIAVIGNNDTKFTKESISGGNILYAYNKRNIIIDTIKVDGRYYDNNPTSSYRAKTAIKFDGTSNNNTINNAQVYNTSLYGIYLGQGSYNNTIMNTQAFNNGSAGIHLYYSSNYNVINNTQTYNNNWYGIWFANGSKRNTLNNFQSYNNTIGVFGDLTTQQNVFNVAAIYNNSELGISLKNSSYNVFHNVRIYNNGLWIRTLYSSIGNTFEGDLKLFANWWGDFSGTNGDDTYLIKDDTLWIWPEWILNTGTTSMSCVYATNPTFSGGWYALLTGNCDATWYNANFVSGNNMYINYAFGLSMYKQENPIRYDTGNNTPVFISSQFDSSKYIAEVFAIRDTVLEWTSASFWSSWSAQLNTLTTSNVYTAGVINTTVTGILSFVPTTANGYLIVNWSNVWFTWTIHNGDTIQIAVVSRTGYNETITGTLTVWTVSANFVVTTRWPNELPTTGSFAFASFTGVQINTFTWSSTTITGLETGVSTSIEFIPTINSGRLEIYSGSTFVYSGSTWLLVYNWYTVRAIAQSSSGYAQMITWKVIIGAGSGTFTLTTRGTLNQLPTTWSLNFLSFIHVPFVTFTWSTTTIAGIETGVSASITFLPTTATGRLEIYSGWIFVSSGTTGLLVYSWNQVKATVQSSSGYTQTITWFVTIGLWTGMFTITTKWSDTTPPTTPTLTYPLSGEELFFITFQWIASVDTGSGIEWYMYEIAEDSDFTDIINTWFITTTTGTMGSPNTWFDATNDTYYRRMKAKDRDGNISTVRSNTGYFEAVELNDRDINEKNNANLNTYYDSNEITLAGIKPGVSVWATVDGNWKLYKNGNDKGTWTLVQNGDDLYITLKSSNDYDDTVSSVLTIANRMLEFTVVTKEEWDNECTLSSDDETTIHDIFDSLVANYSGDENRYEEFLATMQSMLEDEIDFTNDCNLQYLEDLISSEIDGNIWSWSVNTGNHIAPNCKEYAVTYDNAKIAYTSPTFRVANYFANRDALTRYIDSKNPGDCHINTYGVLSWVFTNTDPNRHIAPNGKVYTIQADSQWYTSSEFTTSRYFRTISELRTFIDTRNIPQAIRSHEVDTTFTPQVYAAPTGKEYTIYKTNRWYMSYKLMKVRYFSSLIELHSFININNPR